MDQGLRRIQQATDV